MPKEPNEMNADNPVAMSQIANKNIPRFLGSFIEFLLVCRRTVRLFVSVCCAFHCADSIRQFKAKENHWNDEIRVTRVSMPMSYVLLQKNLAAAPRPARFLERMGCFMQSELSYPPRARSSRDRATRDIP